MNSRVSKTVSCAAFASSADVRAAQEGGQRVRRRAEPRNVGLRDPEQLGEDGDRDHRREVGDQVERLAGSFTVALLELDPAPPRRSRGSADASPRRRAGASPC
jgi:hypothetical protein